MPLEVQLASPCSEKWEAMRGDERSRFCQQCSLHVFNLRDLTETEVRALFLAKEGRVCARVFKRRDGTVLTRDCPTGVKALRLRFVRGLAAASAMVAALIGYRAVTPEPTSPTTTREMTAFERLEYSVSSRVVDVRETLRDTETFGPIIDRFFPRPFTMGRMTSVHPIVNLERK